MNTIYVWGIKFNPLRKTEIVSQVQRGFQMGRRGIHLTGVNPEQVAKSFRDPLLKEAINDSDIVNIDGILIVWTLRAYGFRIPERAATPDIFESLLREANKRKQTIFLLGAEETVLQNMILKIRTEYPDLRIGGFHNGYYRDTEEAAIVKEIARIAPDYLFLGLPTPQKETFILRYKRELPVGCFYGIGGAFDVKGGKVRRAPQWMQRLGLEWLGRIIQSPKNYGKRMCKYYFPFLNLFISELFKKKRWAES